MPLTKGRKWKKGKNAPLRGISRVRPRLDESQRHRTKNVGRIGEAEIAVKLKCLEK